MNKKLEGLNAGLFKGLIVHRDVWEDQELTLSSFLAILNNGLDTCKPHYFPLSSLTKEIRVEGYRDGEAFVPIKELRRMFGYDVDIHEPLNQQSDIEIDIETEDFSQTIDLALGYWIIDQLIKWHFNMFRLPQDQFIDASESKVYEPKKHESC